MFVFLYAVLGIGLIALFGAFAIAGRRVGPNWVQKAARLDVARRLGSAVRDLRLDDRVAAGAGATLPTHPTSGGGSSSGSRQACLPALIGWFIQPKTVPSANELAAAEPLRLAPEERAVWLATTRTTVGALVVIIIAITLVLGASVFVTVQTDGGAWFLLVAPALLLALALLTTSWRVRVDENGLVVRSVMGWPVYRVPVAEIAQGGRDRGLARCRLRRVGAAVGAEPSVRHHHPWRPGARGRSVTTAAPSSSPSTTPRPAPPSLPPIPGHLARSSRSTPAAPRSPR